MAKAMTPPGHADFQRTWKEVTSNSLTWICRKNEEFDIKMGDRSHSSSPWPCRASSLSYVKGLQIREAMETSTLPTLGRGVFWGRVTHLCFFAESQQVCF